MYAHSAFRRTVLTSLIAAIVLCACSSPALASGRVIGGHKVEVDDWAAHWRSLVSVGWAGVSGSDAHFCGGVLIAERTVLTARHCVEQEGFVLEPSLIKVRGGMTSIDASGSSAAVVSIERTPDAPGTWFATGGDLAILELDRAMAGAAPIALAGPEHAAWWGAGAGRPEGVRVAGWGVARDADIVHERSFGPIPSAMQTADLPVLSDDACAASDPTDPSLRLHICAGVREDRGTPAIEGRSSCYGDSGGPLIASDPAGLEPDRLIGIVSRGTQVECSSGTSVFVNVASRSTWIQGVLAAQAGGLRDAGPSFSVRSLPGHRAATVRISGGDAGTSTYAVEFHPRGWRAWYELGRMTGSGRDVAIPPTRDGIGQIRVVRFDEGGREQVMRMSSSSVATLTDRMPPRPVVRFSAARRGAEHVLSWAPGIDRADRVIGYVVEQRPAGRGAWKTEFLDDCVPCRVDKRVKPMHSSREILLPGHREFRIAALDRAGNIGSWTYAVER